MQPRCLSYYGDTRKGALLDSVPPGVTTWTDPVLAPMGTVALMWEPETTVKAALAPLKLTLVAPLRSVPRIWTAAPAMPKGGHVFTKRAKTYG